VGCLVAQGVRRLGMDVGDFVLVVTFLLGLSIVLSVTWLAPFVGLGLAAYYVFRGRVSPGRWDTACCRAWTRPDHGRNGPLLDRHHRVHRVMQGLKPRPDAPGAQEGVERRSWWRRLMGR
jgi:hypothetical protein